LVCDIMRGYYLARQMEDKAFDYRNKSLMYLKTLSDMMIIVTDDAGESLGYLPDFYASDFTDVDIASFPSISAAVNTIFAYYSHNPFALEDKAVFFITE